MTKEEKQKLITDFYMFMVENEYDHNIRSRVENKANIFLESQLQNKVDERDCECCGNKSDAGSQIFVCEDCLISPVITITN